jgi:hypothetical protein
VALIEFLLRNWYVVFIIIGIFSWLRNAKIRPNANETPTNRMPSFGGQSTARHQTDTRLERSMTPDNLEKKQSDTLKTSKELDNQEKTVSPFSVPSGSSAYALSKESLESPMPSGKKQLAQGIIWAEILGPPRSKKPFRKI